MIDRIKNALAELKRDYKKDPRGFAKEAAKIAATLAVTTWLYPTITTNLVAPLINTASRALIALLPFSVAIPAYVAIDFVAPKVEKFFECMRDKFFIMQAKLPSVEEVKCSANKAYESIPSAEEAKNSVYTTYDSCKTMIFSLASDATTTVSELAFGNSTNSSTPTPSNKLH